MRAHALRGRLGHIRGSNITVGLHHRDPVLGLPLRAHTGLGWLLGDGLVRKILIQTFPPRLAYRHRDICRLSHPGDPPGSAPDPVVEGHARVTLRRPVIRPVGLAVRPSRHQHAPQCRRQGAVATGEINSSTSVVVAVELGARGYGVRSISSSRRAALELGMASPTSGAASSEPSSPCRRCDASPRGRRRHRR